MMSEKIPEQVIIDYALENENNLRVAVGVADAISQIRARLVRAFVERLKMKLMENKERQIVDDTFSSRVAEQSAFFSLSTPAWQGRYTVALHANRREAREVYVGIRKVQPSSTRLNEAPELVVELKRKYGGSFANEWWLWGQSLPDPFNNWSSEAALAEMLATMKTGTSTLLTTTEDLLVGIASDLNTYLERSGGASHAMSTS